VKVIQIYDFLDAWLKHLDTTLGVSYHRLYLFLGCQLQTPHGPIDLTGLWNVHISCQWTLPADDLADNSANCFQKLPRSMIEFKSLAGLILAAAFAVANPVDLASKNAVETGTASATVSSTCPGYTRTGEIWNNGDARKNWKDLPLDTYPVSDVFDRIGYWLTRCFAICAGRQESHEGLLRRRLQRRQRCEEKRCLLHNVFCGGLAASISFLSTVFINTLSNLTADTRRLSAYDKEIRTLE